MESRWNKMSKLEFKNVSKAFLRPDNNSITTALDDINFDIHEGEFVSIVGPSGCGENSIIVTDTIIKLNQGLKASTKFLNKMILI